MKRKYYWIAKSDDGSYEDNSKGYFDTEESCYLDMRNAALEKMKWNTEWLDVKEGPGDYDSIGYEVHFAPKRIIHESYSGVYTYDMKEEGLSHFLYDQSEKGMFNFINDYWDDVRGGLESMAVYDMHDDVELCYMACFYGAVNAVEYKHEARYWIGGNSVDKAEKIDNLADLIDSAVDIDDILNDTEFYKSYVDIDKLKNR